MTEGIKKELRRTAKRYQKSGYDWQYVEKKVRANYLPWAAEYILNCYYND